MIPGVLACITLTDRKGGNLQLKTSERRPACTVHKCIRLNSSALNCPLYKFEVPLNHDVQKSSFLGTFGQFIKRGCRTDVG